MASLSNQQQHLLSRLPSWYSVKPEETPEPAEVKQARRIVQKHQDRVSRKEKEFKARFEKKLAAVREAIYFLEPQQALKAVKAFEQEFGSKADR